MACDHIAGAHGSRLVRQSQWAQAAAQYGRGVHFFDATRLAVPPPGFMRAHPYCCDCGKPLDAVKADAAVSAALAVVPEGPELTRETYLDWLLASVHSTDTAATDAA